MENQPLNVGAVVEAERMTIDTKCLKFDHPTERHEFVARCALELTNAIQWPEAWARFRSESVSSDKACQTSRNVRGVSAWKRKRSRSCFAMLFLDCLK